MIARCQSIRSSTRRAFASSVGLKPDVPTVPAHDNLNTPTRINLMPIWQYHCLDRDSLLSSSFSQVNPRTPAPPPPPPPLPASSNSERMSSENRSESLSETGGVPSRTVLSGGSVGVGGNEIEWFPKSGEWVGNSIHAIQSLVIQFHSMGLPWWASIMAGFSTVRLAISPITIYSAYKSYVYQTILPQLHQLERQRIEAWDAWDEDSAFELKQISKGLKASHNITFFNTKIGTIATLGCLGLSWLPVTSAMVVENSPLAGPALWLTDLTIPDPTCVLPILVSSLMLFSCELSNPLLRYLENPKTAKNFSRALALLPLPILIQLPAAVSLTYIPFVLINVLELLLVRSTSFRSLFRLRK